MSQSPLLFQTPFPSYNVKSPHQETIKIYNGLSLIRSQPHPSAMRHLLVVLALCAVGYGQTPTCTSASWNYCNSNLAYTVGLDGQGQQMFKNWTIMYNQFLLLFSQNPGSTAGPLQVCNALEVFNDCLVATGNRGCTAIQTLVQGTDLQSAWFVGGTLGMYQFNCGPGVNTLIHTGLECAQRVLFNYQNYLQTCVSSYQSSITSNPRGACDYVNTLIKCWTTPFYTAPCRRAEAADVWWSCEANNQFTNNQFPNCGIDCDAMSDALTNPPGPNQLSYIQNHHKVVDGAFWYKIPNYFTGQEDKLVEVEGEWMNN